MSLKSRITLKPRILGLWDNLHKQLGLIPGLFLPPFPVQRRRPASGDPWWSQNNPSF